MSPEESQRPLLLIDVDGVLNPLANRLRERIRRGKALPWQLHTLAGFDVVLNPEHGQQLLALTDQCELVWATSWEHEANDLIGPPLGLPVLPVITFDGHGLYSGWTWKIPGIDAFCGERPLAWLDDDFGPDAQRWCTARNKRGAPTALIQIDPLLGLQEAHWQAVRDWLQTLS